MNLDEFEISNDMKQCPCCDYFSLAKRGHSLICPVCFWEDDCEFPDKPDWDEKSDSNNDMTLRQARKNFELYGAFDKGFSETVIGQEERDSLRRVKRIV